jgi:hypothetical protein
MPIALDRVRVVRGAVVHLTCPVLSHLPVCSHVCTRPALCCLHASRIMWPACKPACKPALALALAPKRPAWARAVSVPFAPTSQNHASCGPSRLSLLSGAARPVSLAQTQTSAQPSAPPAQTRAPAGFSPATAARSVAALSMRAPAKSGASDVATDAANPFEIARDSRVRSKECCFPDSVETSPLVVLRKPDQYYFENQTSRTRKFQTKCQLMFLEHVKKHVGPNMPQHASCFWSPGPTRVPQTPHPAPARPVRCPAPTPAHFRP